MQIDIYSDIVCPWCYVGKRRLERALTSVGSDVHVTWRPFQLNPTMPLDGMDRATYLKAKFGSLEAFGRMEEQLLAAGEEERIPFAFEKIQRTPNTFAAHRLVWYAEQQGKQDEMVEALFRGYFLEGKHIGDVKTLTHVAAEAGLDRTETESFLRARKAWLRSRPKKQSVADSAFAGCPISFSTGLSRSPVRSLRISLCPLFSRRKKSPSRLRRGLVNIEAFFISALALRPQARLRCWRAFSTAC